MIIVICTLFAFAGSVVMSAVAFLVGRCGRKLPVDGTLPRVVRSAWFGPADRSCAMPRNSWPNAMN
jgi:hypothetical protein